MGNFPHSALAPGPLSRSSLVLLACKPRPGRDRTSGAQVVQQVAHPNCRPRRRGVRSPTEILISNGIDKRSIKLGPWSIYGFLKRNCNLNRRTNRHYNNYRGRLRCNHLLNNTNEYNTKLFPFFNYPLKRSIRDRCIRRSIRMFSVYIHQSFALGTYRASRKERPAETVAAGTVLRNLLSQQLQENIYNL